MFVEIEKGDENMVKVTLKGDVREYEAGTTIAEIAKSEGCAFMSVKESIERGIRRLEKFFEKDL